MEYKDVLDTMTGEYNNLTKSGRKAADYIFAHRVEAQYMSITALAEECGVTLHTEPMTVEMGDKVFMLAHGDGLGDPDRKFRFLRAVFRNRLCQRMFSCIHPRWAVDFGLSWAAHSRLKHGVEGGDPPYLGEDKEYLVRFAKEYLKAHSEINYFIFGHRHIELDLMLTRSSRVLILGDWITQFTYAVFDGENLFMENYVEGDTCL